LADADSGIEALMAFWTAHLILTGVSQRMG
jgi:hypothetical protein